MKKLILGCVFAAMLAGCQSAPADKPQDKPAPEPQANTAPAENKAEPEPEPEPEPATEQDVVKGQDGKQVIFVLGIDGMD